MTDKQTQIKSWVDEAWDRTVHKINKTSRRIGATFPHITVNGKYDSTKAEWWTSGFWPGLLWLMYRETGDEQLRAYAASCENKWTAFWKNFMN